MNRWQRYWFADGGRHALAIVRIAVATAVLLSLARLSTHPELVAPAGIYRPVGIWMLLGQTPPPGLVVDLLWGLAWTGTLAMLVGFQTRAATAISAGAAIAIASLSFSGTATWSHQYNVVFLAHLALLGARSGDTLSLDALIRHVRGLPPLDVPRGYQWSLRLVQLAVALMFVGAMFHKLAHGNFTLRWAFSDNLRHHLLVRYDLAGLERPPLVTWLIDDVWRYRTAAVLNLIGQLAPLFAILFVRRPLVRALAGALFVVEVIGLGLVVNLWNWHWLPLAAVFVDWDRLVAVLAGLGRQGRSPSSQSSQSPLPPGAPGWQPSRAIQAFILAFVAYDGLTAFIPTLDRQLNTYPFSSFPMFATVRATPPYDEHHPYNVVGDHFTVTSGAPLPPYAQSWFDHTNRNLHRITDPVSLGARLASILGRAQRRYPELAITGVRHYLTLFHAPAYPEPARFDMNPIAVTGELTPAGDLVTLLGTWSGTTVVIRPQHLDATAARLVYYADNQPLAHDLPATRTGNTFTIAPITAASVYIVAIIGDQAWLVARR